MLNRKSYVGVTGFTEREQVEEALSVVPADSDRLLMVGVLATWKTLRGIPIKPKWGKQTPLTKNIKDIFVSDPRVLNLIHYSTQTGQENSLADDMERLHHTVGEKLDGFQLNIAWPNPVLLEYYYYDVWNHVNAPRIVLQVGRRALEAVSGNFDAAVNRLMDYTGIVTDVLFDLSGGLGKEIDINQALRFLRKLDEVGLGFGKGIAGGLGPNSLDPVVYIGQEFPGVSTDAQGRLRDEENELVLPWMKRYLQQSYGIFQ